MNRRQKIIVSVTGIFIVLLLLVGLTYGYFLTKITGNNNDTSISVKTANLVLNYGEETSSVITKSQLMPGDVAATKVFTATNNGNSDVTYGASLQNIVNEFSRQEDLIYTLICTSYIKEGFTLANDGTITGTEDGICMGKDETQFPNTKEYQVMVTNTIDINHIHAYKLTITYKNQNVDQSEDMNKTLSTKVNLLDTVALTVDNPYKNETNTLKKAIIDNAILSINSTEYRETPLITIGEPANPSYTRMYNLTYTTPNETQYEHKYKEAITNYSNSFKFYCYEGDSNYTFYSCDNFGGIDISDKEVLVPTGVKVGAYVTGNAGTECGVGKYFYDASQSITVSSSETNSYYTFYEVLECTDGLPSKSRVMYFSWNEKEKVEVTDKREKTLSKTEDDLGTSYYYRGNIEDNYVNFAGMCWKIVRINGDGSIKLYLANKDEECSPDMEYNASVGSGIYGYSENSDGTYKLDYVNSIESSLVDVFKEFQTSTLSSYLNKLKSGDWCIDIFNSDEINLKCSETLTNKFKDNTDMYVATLTADEFIYAGTVYLGNYFDAGKVENRFYLNYGNGYNVPTLTYEGRTFESLDSTEGAGPSAYGLYVTTNDYGNIGGSNYIYGTGPFYAASSFRYAVPSINLKSDVEISSGDGTLTNPYIIN